MAGALAATLVFPLTIFGQQPGETGSNSSAADSKPASAEMLPSVSVSHPLLPQTPNVTPPVAGKPLATVAAPSTPATPKQQRQAEKLYLQGAKAIEQNNPRVAFEDFTRAVSLNPSNSQYAAAKEIARQHLITLLVQEADKARLSQHPEDSRKKLEEALALDPKNPFVRQHVDELADDQKMSFDQVDEAGVSAEGPIELTPSNGKKSFHLKGSQQDILRQVLSAYQVTPVMDSSVTSQAIRLDADDLDYAQAAQMLNLVTGTFFVPLDPRRVLVAKDTKENRSKFERLLVESIYLPGLNTTELNDISNVAKTVFEAPVASLQPQRNILTVRAPEPRMKALNATLEELLDGRAQVMIEVKLYDITRTRTTNIGVVLPSQTNVFNVDSELNGLLQNNQAAINQIISSGLAAPGDYGAILAILIATGQVTSSVLTQGFLTFGGGLSQFGYNLGTVSGNLQLNSSDARALDDIHLRVQDQEAATFKVGSRYPIVSSTYSSGGGSLNVPGISTAGLSSTLNGLGVNLSSLSAQVTIPQIQYEDLGLTLKATPRVQHGQEVALNMDLELTALGGSTLDGNPILNNRKYTATITLKDGSSALVVSNLSKQENKAVTGLPGLDELPGLRSATNDAKDLNISTLVLLVTPHIVRRSHMEVAGREILLPRHD
ncbi:General secretion pathway protein D [Acidisarcina polymorpha]|uniref:General secretion pathway protein D n=2 Tax=Acidisarcina polymorpha TaxID=2211140 RepID=A0A2Z5FVB3_9BACT|nr:General secretion pathway protein D [Acidisarcina polymorpha]